MFEYNRNVFFEYLGYIFYLISILYSILYSILLSIIYFICLTFFPFGLLDMAVYTLYIYAIFPRLMPLLAQLLSNIPLENFTWLSKAAATPTKSFIIHRLPLLYIAGNISSQLLTNRYTHPRTHTLHNAENVRISAAMLHKLLHNSSFVEGR